MIDKIVLIGGAPTVGKSYLARKLSEKFKLPWISTDGIRDQMRKIVKEEDYPALFYFDESKGLTAEGYLATHTPQQIVDDQNMESEDVWKGARAFIDTDYVWKSFIVEGVAILPKFVSEIKQDKLIIPIFIVDENRDRIKEMVYGRGLWGDAKTYSDDVKGVEVEWALLFSKYIKNEATKYGFDFYEIGERDKLVEQISELVTEKLKDNA
jgi:2-phosphoglycerate kinase